MRLVLVISHQQLQNRPALGLVFKARWTGTAPQELPSLKLHYGGFSCKIP